MIIDSHMHLGYLSGMHNYDVRMETLLDTMDSLGIEKAISSSGYNLLFGDMERGYLADIEAYETSKGRILSYFVYDPGDGDGSLRLMESHFAPAIFKGIKLHPSWHNVFADDEAYRPVYEYARSKKLPVISHTWTISLTNPVQKFSTPDRFEKYAVEYGDVTLILAHAGGRYDGICQAIALAKKSPNVCVDIAGDIYIDGLVETLVAEIGPERVLFGSDYPMMDHRNMLGAVLGADVSVTDKKSILHDNAVRIFGLEV